GRKACGPARSGANEIRAGHQSRNRQGARPYRAVLPARPRRRGDRMKRREVIALVCGAAVAGPVSARGPKAPERLRHIGVLSSAGADDPGEKTRLAAFQQGLQQLGWTGSNVRIEYRWAAGDPERIARYAVELVALAPDVILATSGTNLPALFQA